MRWPECSATVLAIEMSCPSATMVSANARPISSDACVQLTWGNSKRGQGVAMVPTRRNAAAGVALPPIKTSRHNHARVVAVTSPISM